MKNDGVGEKEHSRKEVKKLSYKDKRELETLPKKIEELEAAIDLLQHKVNEPSFFQQDSEQTKPILDELTKNEEELANAYERWDELESFNE